MKWLCLILFLVMAPILAMNAQSNYGFGVKGGLTYSIHWSGLFGEDESLLAFHAGAHFHYSISGHFAVQPELLISRKGEKGGDDYMEWKHILTYVDIPVLLRFHPTPNNPFFNIQAGPQLGYLIRAHGFVEAKDVAWEGNIKDRYESVELGLALGFEFNFRSRINLTLRYTNGLFKSQNYVLYLSAGYRIIGK